MRGIEPISESRPTRDHVGWYLVERRPSPGSINHAKRLSSLNGALLPRPTLSSCSLMQWLILGLPVRMHNCIYINWFTSDVGFLQEYTPYWMGNSVVLQCAAGKRRNRHSMVWKQDVWKRPHMVWEGWRTINSTPSTVQGICHAGRTCVWRSRSFRIKRLFPPPWAGGKHLFKWCGGRWDPVKLMRDITFWCPTGALWVAWLTLDRVVKVVGKDMDINSCRVNMRDCGWMHHQSVVIFSNPSILQSQAYETRQEVRVIPYGSHPYIYIHRSTEPSRAGTNSMVFLHSVAIDFSRHQHLRVSSINQWVDGRILSFRLIPGRVVISVVVRELWSGASRFALCTPRFCGGGEMTDRVVLLLN